jgi:hypothetical protein
MKAAPMAAKAVTDEHSTIFKKNKRLKREKQQKNN